VQARKRGGLLSRIIRGKQSKVLRSRAVGCSRYPRCQFLKFRSAQPLTATTIDLKQGFSYKLASKWVAMIVLDAEVHHLPVMSLWVRRNVIPLGCLSQFDGILLSFASQYSLARPVMDPSPPAPWGPKYRRRMRLCTNKPANLFSPEDVSLLMSSLCLRWSPKLGSKTASEWDTVIRVTSHYPVMYSTPTN
jgi:hypothetical protein